MDAVAARLQWVCDNPRDIERWDPKLLDTRTLATPQPEIATTWPARYRYGMSVLARLPPSSSTPTSSTCSGSPEFLNAAAMLNIRRTLRPFGCSDRLPSDRRAAVDEYRLSGDERCLVG